MMPSGMGSTTILHNSIFPVRVSQMGHEGTNSAQSFLVRSTFNSGRLLHRSEPPLSASALNRLRDSQRPQRLGRKHYPQGRDRR
jgi:hypothetical protein